ncbi:TraB/GumN family protein [Vibrio thalassae]|uniref:TraB/GumN family protein n=1 Tax=Vibrio thalassae TaxID=1243014 RepID=UPI0036365F88
MPRDIQAHTVINYLRPSFTGLLLLVSLCSNAEPLLWQADKGEQRLYLMGTIHVGDTKLDPFSRKVTEALSQADSLIVETRLNEKVRFPQKPQPSAKQMLDEEHLAALIAIIKQASLVPSTILSLPPWQAALTLQQWQFQSLNYQPEFSIDMQFVRWANTHQLPIVGLETLQFQIDLFVTQPDHGLAMLKQTLQEWSDSEASIRCLVESWRMGDIKNLEAVLATVTYNEAFYQSFIFERNERWVKVLSQDYPVGTYFVAVGAMHLVGEHSVIELLRQLGYDISLMSTPSRAHCSTSSDS